MGNLTVKESGEMVNIISPNANNITSFKVHFSPKQEGTGDPSPENVREIVGWNGVEGYKCGKNMAHIFGYGTQNILDTDVSRYKTTNSYGTTINTTIFNNPDTPLVIEQSQAPNSTLISSYQNGYIAIGTDNLIFGQKYNVSFKVSNITNNILNISLNSIKLLVPNGDSAIATEIIDDVLIFKNITFYQNTTTPKRQGFEIRICGLSFTLSEFMVTAVDNEDYTYEPFQGTTTSIDWTNNVGNIYGGYVDLVTGEIWKSYDIASGLWKNWDTSGELDNYIRKRLVTPYKPVGGNASSTSLCNITGTYLWSNTTESTHFYVGNSGNTVYAILPKTLDENQEVQISYKLTEPVYVTTLSPTQLSTLKGQNNFWSNADYVEIEYELTETFDIQKAKRKIILNQPHVESTSGTIAKPETDMIGKIKECKIHFMPVQQSDSDPTPDNIVPVTGWTGIDMYSTGKNLFNLNVPVGLPSSTDSSLSTNRIFTPYTVIKGTSGTNYYSPGAVNSYSINDDILTVNSRSGYGVGFAIKIKPNQTYTISGSADSEYGAVAISTYSRDGKFTKIREVSRFINYPYYSFNTNSQADMLVLTFYAPSGGYNIDIHYSNIQLEIGNTVTNYEPFKGNITSVNWENEIGTMYGGYVDLISGKLVQEFKQCKINELSWTYIASGACFVTSKNTPNDILKNRSLLISYIRSDYYTPIDGYGDIATYNNFQDYSISLYAPSDQYRIAIKDSRFTDVSSFLSAMGDTYIWYRLAEPTVTYQLTPQQLTTLRGINNIWSSANGEVEIKYWKH